MISNNYNDPDTQNYGDRLEIRIKRQKETHVIEFYDGVRIDPATLPKGKHLYHTRHSDTDMSQPVTIAPEGVAIIVNFCGSIVTDIPLDVKTEIKLMFVNWL